MSSTFSDFIYSFKQLTNETVKIYSRVHIVLGNEAGDLDSAVCSLCYAYYLHLKCQQDKTLHIPVINVLREDISLRTEVVHYLPNCGINSDNLLFIDSLDWSAIQARKQLAITLVDHNTLASSQSDFSTSIVQIIDHHDRTSQTVAVSNSKFEPVGSCATLVAEEILSDSCLKQKFSKEFYKLLYGAIVLDTVNLSGERGRCTAKDVATAKKLGNILRYDGTTRDALFHDLQHAKFDISALTTRDLLRKDLKVVSNGKLCIGISSIGGLDYVTIVTRADFERDCKEFLISQKYHVLVVMTIGESEGGMRRGLLVLDGGQHLADKICTQLSALSNNQIGLREITRYSSAKLRVFEQMNLKASRKVVLPEIQAILDSASL